MKNIIQTACLSNTIVNLIHRSNWTALSQTSKTNMPNIISFTLFLSFILFSCSLSFRGLFITILLLLSFVVLVASFLQFSVVSCNVLLWCLVVAFTISFWMYASYRFSRSYIIYFYPFSHCCRFIFLSRMENLTSYLFLSFFSQG